MITFDEINNHITITIDAEESRLLAIACRGAGNYAAGSEPHIDEEIIVAGGKPHNVAATYWSLGAAFDAAALAALASRHLSRRDREGFSLSAMRRSEDGSGIDRLPSGELYPKSDATDGSETT